MTVVPFLPDEGDRLVLPTGPVLPGEDPLVDTALRVAGSRGRRPTC